LQADWDGRHLEFAEAFEASERSKEVLREVELYSTNKDEITEETMKELSVQRATTNGFFFTLKTILKVGVSIFHPLAGYAVVISFEWKSAVLCSPSTRKLANPP